MNEMKKIALVTLAMVVLFILGCKEEVVEEKPVVSFIGGDKGVELSFLPGAPPDVVFDKNFPFSVGIQAENVGEWDITNPKDLTIKLIGINPADFGTSLEALKKDSPTALMGKHLDPAGNVIRGTLVNVEFPDLQYQTEITGSVEYVLRAEACYEYGTKAVSRICILDDLLGVTRKPGEKPICEPNEAKTVENSGAPVHVLSVRESVAGPDKVSLTIEIGHVGSGSVHQRFSECGSEIAQRDRVYVKVDTGLPGLSCSGLAAGNEGYVTLYGGKREIVCMQPLPTPRGDFEKPISIELTYGYKDYIDKKLIVKHAGSS